MKLRETAYLTGVPPLPERLVLTGIREDVASHVKSAALPDDCPESEDVFARLAVSEIDALSPHPIDGEASIADRELLRDLARHAERVSETEQHARGARAIVERTTNTFINTPPCWSTSRLAALCFGYVALAALVAASVGLLLATTLDDSFLSNYFADKTDEPEAVAMWASFLAASGLVFVQCVLQLVYVIAIRGDVTAGRKFGLLLFDLVFAAAWGAQRLADGGHVLAVSLTLIEFVAAAFFTWAVGGLADALKRNGARIEPHRDAKAALGFADKAVKAAEKRLAKAEQDRYALLVPLAAREAAVRAASARRSAAEETARVRYRVATAELAADAAKNPALDALMAGLDHHTAVFQTRVDRKTNGRNS